MTGRDKALQAAAILFVRQGYDHTTMDDIARAAGLARSTLYTYWRSSDMLMTELLWREGLHYLDDWLARVEADPAGGTFANLYRHAVYAIQASPFTQALYTHEQHMLGSYLLQPAMNNLMLDRFSATAELFAMLRAAGVIQPLADDRVLAYISATFRYGLLISNERIPREQAPPATEVLDVFLTMLTSVLPSGDASHASEQGKIVLRAYVRRVQQYAAAGGTRSSE